MVTHGRRRSGPTEGIENPWDKFLDPLECTFVRSRFKWNKVTQRFEADEKTEFLVKKLVDQYKECESSQGSTARWGTPLTRAINQTLGKEVNKKLICGRVSGAGTGAKWKIHYAETKEEKLA